MSGSRSSRGAGRRLEVVAVVDARPLLVLPSLISLSGEVGSITLVAASANDVLASRLAVLLQRLFPAIGRQPGSAIVTIRDLPSVLDAAMDRGRLDLDVSGASPRAAIEAFQTALSIVGTQAFDVSSYDARRNRITITEFCSRPDPSPRPVRSGKPVDFGSDGRVRPSDFLGLFGLRETTEDPYPALLAPRDARSLRAAARSVLQSFLPPSDANALSSFRRSLALGRLRAETANLRLPKAALPEGVAEACRELAQIGLLREEAGSFVLPGPADRNAFFFLGGGWLEIACHEALAAALPDRIVELNAGIRWHPGAARAEAEADILFVHGGSLCVVSCKNDWNDERVFSHLREFRALVAEMGEGFVRPMLVSTRPLTEHEEARASSFEIGTFSGLPLLESLRADLEGAPGTFLSALRGRGRGEPAPGSRWHI